MKFTPNTYVLEGVEQASAKKVAGTVLARVVPLTPQDTGNLARSWAMRPIRNGYEVGTGVVYAPFVEFGTRRMAARAMLGRALQQVARQYGLRLMRGR